MWEKAQKQHPENLRSMNFCLGLNISNNLWNQQNINSTFVFLGVCFEIA